MTCGVYCIRNKENGKRYIGSSKNIEERWGSHVKGRNSNSHLQNAFAKYGIESFEFSILEKCDNTMLVVTEQKYLDKFHPEYNKSPSAGSNRGMSYSEAVKGKISNSLKEFFSSEEERKKKSIENTGNQNLIKAMLGNTNAKGNKGSPNCIKAMQKLHSTKEYKMEQSKRITEWWKKRKAGEQ